MKKLALLITVILTLFGCAADKKYIAKSEPPALTSGIDLQYVDKSVRPQDDFYRYVNGKWLAEFVMPADKSRYGSFNALRDKSEKDVKTIIDNLAANTYDNGTDEQKISDLYNSYMDTDSIEKAGINVLDKDLKKINSIKNYDDLLAYMAYADMYTDAPMGLYVYIDLKDSNKHITYVSQSGLGLPEKDYYSNQSDKFKNIRSKYVTLIENMFTHAGFDNPAQSAQTVMKIETKIADGHWSNVQVRDVEKSYNLNSYAEFQGLMPDLNIEAWMQGTTLKNVPEIVVRQPDYLQKLNQIITETSIDDWKTYYTWKLLNTAAIYLPKQFDDERFKFYGTVLKGTTEQKPRWKRAISTVNASIGELVGKVYIKSFYPPEAKTRMDNMIENLRTAYGESIRDLDWMSEQTKTKALEKLHKFNPKIGYPSKWKDYSSLNISKDSLLDNMIAVQTWGINRNRSKLGQPIDRTEWSMNPQTVNAYYNPTKNEIVFPAGILQPPFFNLAADDAVNYGGIGAVIGHEMGHGFDDQGSLFDGDGNLNSWWTDEDREKFNAKTAILIEQYNAYEVLDGAAHVNGELTQGENIGDLSGVTIAYRAYKNAYPENTVIDGLSSDERFFFGWAQVWRSMMRDEAILQQVTANPHSPAEFRGNGPLRNFPPFLELYNVQAGDKMFLPPEKRVKIW
ncbi:Peptidase, M13 family [hydrothermal vent metagenome]|uniref:Peptidase, M13 family n=1 Tax=hydrothermal vent metagenome TaxID=652676 RepID=A0A3B0V1E7_9ZZZZ